ncbi:hypothetical protein BH09PLA1_BH09PLA1_23190 [soil metagenome]
MPGDPDEESGDAEAPRNEGDSDRIVPLSEAGDGTMNVPFDRYVLVRTIGEGAMGIVYEGRQEKPKRTVAVKVVKSRHASAAAEKRFLEETQSLALLNHQHIAHLYDAGVHRQGVLEVPYYVMELVWGASSITAFADRKKLGTLARVELFLQVCAAVRHAHENEIVHCDLKPSNILVNGQGQVKVIDFGVARSMRLDDFVDATWSDRSVLCGTPQYMSPEQVQGFDFEMDERSDIYTLGVILFELLCGRLPYVVDKSTPLTAARSILNSNPIAPRKIDRSLSSDVRRVLSKGLIKDRDQRYASVGELEVDLNRLLRGEPVPPAGHKLTFLQRWSERWIAKRRLFAAAVTVLCVAFICTTAGAWIWNLGLNHKFEVFLTQKIHHVQSAPLKHVVILKITDATNFPLLAGIQPDDPPDAAHDPRFGRRLHGQLLRTLAAAGVKPKAIAFDVYFSAESHWDDEFAAGLRAIAPTPVIVGHRRAGIDAPGESGVAPKLSPYVFAGGAAGVVHGDAPWANDLVTTLPNGGLFPSIALVTASQCWQPKQIPAMEWLLDAVKLRYANSQQHEVDVTTIAEMPDENPDLGLIKGTPHAEYMIEIPSDAHLDQSSVEYRDVLNWSADAIRERFNDKVIVIGEFRTGLDGPYPYPDGRGFHGCLVQAVAIDRLLTGDPLTRPPYVSFAGFHVKSDLLIALGITVASAMIARVLSRKILIRVIIYAAFGAILVAASLMSFRLGGIIFSPLSPLLCLLVAGEAVAFIYRTRESTISGSV